MVWLAYLLATGLIGFLVWRALKKMGSTPTPVATPSGPKKPEKSYKTKGGMGIDVMRSGSGTPAKFGDTVTVHYKAFLTNGREVDSSYDRGQSFSFKLGTGAVIIGWDECIRGMKTGEMRKVSIPPKFAYGKKGSGKVPPNSTIVFEIDLIGIEPK